MTRNTNHCPPVIRYSYLTYFPLTMNVFQAKEYDLQIKINSLQDLDKSRRVIYDQNQELLQSYEEKDMQAKDFAEKW